MGGDYLQPRGKAVKYMYMQYSSVQSYLCRTIKYRLSCMHYFLDVDVVELLLLLLLLLLIVAQMDAIKAPITANVTIAAAGIIEAAVAVPAVVPVVKCFIANT
mmetsp:Transcript_34370/g.38649  ORF Transcript_34370/g.38649 Transcript_34370/m.38649 type:complete len:103 (+) Transcript_34370:90-398(+)